MDSGDCKSNMKRMGSDNDLPEPKKIGTNDGIFFQFEQDINNPFCNRAFNAYNMDKTNMTFLKALLEQDTSGIDSIGMDGNTLLMLEVMNVDNFMYLIEKGANPHICHRDGYNVLLLAAKKESPITVLETLTSRKVDANTVDTCGKFALLYELERRLDGRDDNTAHDTVERVRMLLEAGANPSKQSIYGETPLMAAIGHNKQGPRLVELLCKYGADTNITDDQGDSVLHLFSARVYEMSNINNIDIYEYIFPIFKLILENGYNVMKSNRRGSTVIHRLILYFLDRNVFGIKYIIPVLEILVKSAVQRAIHDPSEIQDENNPLSLLLKASINYPSFPELDNLILLVLNSPFQAANVKFSSKLFGYPRPFICNSLELITIFHNYRFGMYFKRYQEYYDVVCCLVVRFLKNVIGSDDRVLGISPYMRQMRRDFLELPDHVEDEVIGNYNMTSMFSELRRWIKILKYEGFRIRNAENVASPLTLLAGKCKTVYRNYQHLELYSLMEELMSEGVNYMHRIHRFRDTNLQKLSEDLQLSDVLCMALMRGHKQLLPFLLKYWHHHPMIALLFFKPNATAFVRNGIQLRKSDIRRIARYVTDLLQLFYDVGGPLPHGSKYFYDVRNHLIDLDKYVEEKLSDDEFNRAELMHIHVYHQVHEPGDVIEPNYINQPPLDDEIEEISKNAKTFCEYHKQPVSLVQLCRYKIRSCIPSGNNLPGHLKSLVPIGLQDFITYNDYVLEVETDN